MAGTGSRPPVANASLRDLIYRHRLAGKRAVALAGRILPAPVSRRLRAIAEQIAFRVRPAYQGDTLPPIFHYWSARHLAPLLHQLDIHSIEQFYLDGIIEAAKAAARPIEILSLGTGACALEIDLSARLRDVRVPFRMTCIDFNRQLLRAAADAAASQGLSREMRFLAMDCNRLSELPRCDVVIVNQFFHHVENLEAFCLAIGKALDPDGRVLTSDVVGRNGHLLWPDVERAVAGFWDELPADKRVDRYFGGPRPGYRPVDHASYSNEGVRAQDVVGCLQQQFAFEIFVTFGGCIVPFVERRIGFNFDAEDPDDRAFIDRVHAADADALARRVYPASNMIASLRHKGRSRRQRFHPVGPDEHVRLARVQAEKAR